MKPNRAFRFSSVFRQTVVPLLLLSTTSCAPSVHPDTLIVAQLVRPLRVTDIAGVIANEESSAVQGEFLFPKYSPADLATMPYVFVCFDKRRDRLFVDAAVLPPGILARDGALASVRVGGTNEWSSVTPHRVEKLLADLRTDINELMSPASTGGAPVLKTDRFEGTSHVRCVQ